MKFNIDQAKLTGKVSDSTLKILFKLPKDWKLIDSKLFEKSGYNANLQNIQDEKINITPLYIFTNGSLKYLLDISQIKLSNDKKSNEVKIKEYENAL